MKLMVRKLWFQGNVDRAVGALFRIPQLEEQFSGGCVYDGEMRPRGMKICSRYWPAVAIMGKLPKSGEDVYLVLTSMDLRGDCGRIDYRGSDRRAIVSNDSFISKESRTFNPYNVNFNAAAFGAIGYALGLKHHDFELGDPCEMSHNENPGPNWRSLYDIRFCDDCHAKIA